MGQEKNCSDAILIPKGAEDLLLHGNELRGLIYIYWYINEYINSSAKKKPLFFQNFNHEFSLKNVDDCEMRRSLFLFAQLGSRIWESVQGQGPKRV